MDPNNCGGCGSTCTGGTCSGGVCKLIPPSPDGGGVPAVGDNACLTVDKNAVYDGIASDGVSLFWAANGSGEIWKLDLNVGVAQTIVTGQTGPLFVVLDALHVFWNNAGDGTVWQADKNGQNATRLANNLSQGHLGYLAVDAQSVYFTDELAGIVGSAPIGGNGNQVTLAGGQGRPTGIAVTGQALFWSNSTAGNIVRMPLGGAVGTPMPIAGSLASPNAVVVDGTSVYFSQDVQAGSIGKVGVLGGTPPATLASNQAFPTCIAVDATSVYWIDEGGGTISKTAK
jgi:hypothetical protein